jgi:hypothetical protein
VIKAPGSRRLHQSIRPGTSSTSYSLPPRVTRRDVSRGGRHSASSYTVTRVIRILTPLDSPKLLLHEADNDTESQSRPQSPLAASPAPPSPPQPVFSAQSYLRYQGSKFTAADCYIHITRKMDTHELAQDQIVLASLTSPRTICSFRTRVVTLITPCTGHRYRNGWVVDYDRTAGFGCSYP